MKSILASGPVKGLIGALVGVVVSFSNLSAQNLFQDTALYYKADLNPVMGRDFWFTPPALFTVNNGKVYELCITSPKNAAVFLQCGPLVNDTIMVKAGVTTAFFLPLTHEVTSSGIIETDKAYHVWCDTADLDLLLVADNTVGVGAAGDAMHILPTFALGADYVVASYTAAFIGEGNSYDYPSEMTITSEHDNTVVTILPTADLRQETQQNPNPTSVAHPAGRSFPVTLQRGETVQFKTVTSTDPESYDLSGTVINSNYPVAVIGASQRTYIPATFPPVWNYIADMIPPIRSWGKTYYTTPYAQPSGITNHDASTFLVVGTANSQIIYRYDENSGSQVFCTLGNKYDFSFGNDVSLPSRWYSDAPFMLVQYMNSPDYPDSVEKAKGSPSMMVVQPISEFGTSGTLQTPIQSGSYAANYAMYIDVIANANAGAATFDGKSIKTWAKKPVDSAWTIYRNTGLTSGTHVFSSDLPIGAYAYGYANTNIESISYPAQTALIDTASTDIVPASIIWTLNGGSAHAAIADSNSGLSHVAIDTVQNFIYSPDAGFIPGFGVQSTFLAFTLTDASKNGTVSFTAYDMAGNRSVGKLFYVVPKQSGLKAGFTFTSSGFDTVKVGTDKTLGAATLTDTSSELAITFDSIWSDNPVFVDTALADKKPLTLTPGEQHVLQITFTPAQNNLYTAKLHARSTSPAGAQEVQLTGLGYTSTVGVQSTTGTLADWLANGTGSMMLLPVSPNPTMNSLQINYALRASGNVRFQIFSERGTRVFDWNGNNESYGVHLQSLDFGAIESGSYLYRFSVGGEERSGKIVIEK